jgi:hypothetical protein
MPSHHAANVGPYMACVVGSVYATANTFAIATTLRLGTAVFGPAPHEAYSSPSLRLIFVRVYYWTVSSVGFSSCSRRVDYPTCG